MDRRREVQVGQHAHERAVEVGDCAREEPHFAAPTLTRAHENTMVEKVELDLEHACRGRHRHRSEAP
jgi:hypothetical protein